MGESNEPIDSMISAGAVLIPLQKYQGKLVWYEGEVRKVIQLYIMISMDACCFIARHQVHGLAFALGAWKFDD